jgi:Domain of unknown function (DUF4194)
VNEFDAPDLKQADLFDLLRGESMNRPAPIPEEAVAEEGGLDEAEALQPTDSDSSRGRLPHEARRALVGLLRHGVIMATNKRLLFEALCRFRVQIDAHLADMYLRMLLDEPAGLAILLQQELDDSDDEEEGGSLISRRTLTLYDTLLLLVLRRHYQDREAAGEQKVIIDLERIEIALRPFLPLTNSSRSDRRQLKGALEKMKQRRILSAVRGEDERFEITPVIRYVVNAAFLEQMLSEYQKLAVQADGGSEGERFDE